MSLYRNETGFGYFLFLSKPWQPLISRKTEPTHKKLLPRRFLPWFILPLMPGVFAFLGRSITTGNRWRECTDRNRRFTFGAVNIDSHNWIINIIFGILFSVYSQSKPLYTIRQHFSVGNLNHSRRKDRDRNSYI